MANYGGQQPAYAPGMAPAYAQPPPAYGQPQRPPPAQLVDPNTGQVLALDTNHDGVFETPVVQQHQPQPLVQMHGQPQQQQQPMGYPPQGQPMMQQQQGYGQPVHGQPVHGQPMVQMSGVMPPQQHPPPGGYPAGGGGYQPVKPGQTADMSGPPGGQPYVQTGMPSSSHAGPRPPGATAHFQSNNAKKGCCGGKVFIILLVVLGLLILGMFIGGPALKTKGEDDKAIAENLDPEEDFNLLVDACQIISVDYRAETKSEESCSGSGSSSSRRRCTTKYTCDDIYVYRFTYRGSGSTTYTSKTESLRRCDESCGSCGVKSGAFARGNTLLPSASDTLTCWQPAIPTAALSSIYNCGNSQCFKVFDPEDDIGDALDAAKALIIAGWVVIGLGMCFSACFIGVYMMNRRKK